MVSGINNTLPLLTIAIPTWNRAETLNKALGFLLPQIIQFKDEIEIVVSDNASDDNTKEIVRNYISTYTELNILYNRNSENIKFFGNFKKCRELANGKYIWLLSDDDFVCEDVVKEIMLNLHSDNDYAAIYLKNSHNINSMHSDVLTYEELIRKETFRISLISSVIFLNDKLNDEMLMERYSGSSFIGFIFLLNSFNFKNMVLRIQGKCLNAVNDRQEGYNFFDVFVNHMEHVIDYMRIMKMTKKDINHFRSSFLIEFIHPIYLLFKAEKKLNFGDFEPTSITDVEFWIKKKYSDLRCFWFFFYPFILIPSPFLTYALKFRRFIKKHK